jgi:RimJ/RimL family protein N-acetyltransferase
MAMVMLGHFADFYRQARPTNAVSGRVSVWQLTLHLQQAISPRTRSGATVHLMVSPFEDRTTARLCLRRPVLDDLSSFVAIDSDPKTNLYRPGGAPSSERSAQTFREFLRAWDAHGVGYWVVELSDEVIGMAGVESQLFSNRSCWNLYYRLSPDVWGKSFAVEATNEAVAMASKKEPTWPVVARTRPLNYAAAHVAMKAGLQRRPELDVSGFEVFALGW